MAAEQRLIQLIEKFTNKYEGGLHANTALLNSKEIYYTAHAYTNVLSVYENIDQAALLKGKLLKIIEEVLEYDK